MLRFNESPNRATGLNVTANPRTVLSSVGLLEASQAEAEAGAILGRYMSPLRVAQALAALLWTIPPPAPRIITAAGALTIAATDRAIILNKVSPSVTPVQLPTVASRNGLALLIADFAGNGGDITITPATGEKIMGLAANAPWTVGSGGAGLGGSIMLTPVVTVGWCIGAP